MFLLALFKHREITYSILITNEIVDESRAVRTKAWNLKVKSRKDKLSVVEWDIILVVMVKKGFGNTLGNGCTNLSNIRSLDFWYSLVANQEG